MIEGKRIALIIGNGAYEIGRLNNPGNDARAMASTLRSLGFEVIAREDLNRDAMLRSLINFRDRMGEGGIALFYYSGHGLQISGKNYLVPLGAQLTDPRYVDVDTVDLDAVLKQMNDARNRLNVVILDACRNNPLTRGWRDAVRGLAPASAPPGTLVAYATDPGDVALDGDPGGNSP